MEGNGHDLIGSSEENYDTSEIGYRPQESVMRWKIYGVAIWKVGSAMLLYRKYTE